MPKQLLLALLLVGCTAPAPSSERTDGPAHQTAAQKAASVASATPSESALWSELLSRPLSLPSMPAGRQRPVSAERMFRPFEGAQPFLVLGDGPAYPSIRATPKFQHDSTWVADDGRRYHKGLWLVDASYPGPVLARGRALDGSGEIHWDDGGPRPPTELRIEPTPTYIFTPAPSHRDRPSSWSVPAPGCYGIQIDGIGFSKVIVFEVRP